MMARPHSPIGIHRGVKSMAHLSRRQKLTPVYPFGGPARFGPIPPDKYTWEVDWDEYNPPRFTIPRILQGGMPWADPDKIGVDGFAPKFNEMDGKINRVSYFFKYTLDKGGYPLNILGRTGLAGRGSLGRWGPNHAADCVVTRWKLDGNEKVVMNPVDKLPVLEFVAILRSDSGELAIPGGMVDEGEEPVTAAKREFVEEVLGLEYNNLAKDGPLSDDMAKIFANETIIEQGLVDDRRNTDNAWMESCVVNFHISAKNLQIFDKMKFKSGSDATAAFWQEYHSSLKMYANHGYFLAKTATILHENWEREQKSE